MSEMASVPVRRPISVRDYHRMGEAGIIGHDERVELIDGELVLMPPMRPPHAGRISALTSLFSQRFNQRAIVRVQLPVTLEPDSEPEPDLALVEPGPQWDLRHPTAADLRLVIEISDTTRAFDLGPKAQLYARAGIADLWIVDIGRSVLVVHRDPGGTEYARVTILRSGDTVAPLAYAGEQIDVADILT